VCNTIRITFKAYKIIISHYSQLIKVKLSKLFTAETLNQTAGDASAETKAYDDVEVAIVAHGSSIAVPANDRQWLRRVPSLTHEQV